jgi:hypothetical protein
MKIQDIKDIAKEKGINDGIMNKTDLIIAIQIVEGHEACFATSSAQICSQLNCLWSSDCKEEFKFRFE